MAAGSGGEIQGSEMVCSPHLRQMTLAVHAKFSWEGGIKGGAKYLRMEQGTVAGGSLRGVCLIFKLKYRTVGEENRLEEFRHANNNKKRMFN